MIRRSLYFTNRRQYRLDQLWAGIEANPPIFDDEVRTCERCHAPAVWTNRHENPVEVVLSSSARDSDLCQTCLRHMFGCLPRPLTLGILGWNKIKKEAQK